MSNRYYNYKALAKSFPDAKKAVHRCQVHQETQKNGKKQVKQTGGIHHLRKGQVNGLSYSREISVCYTIRFMSSLR